MSKAFDVVSIQALLSCLNKNGITGNMWNWIYSYLTNRKQFVKLAQSRSEGFVVNSGVPQGSHLGPLFFIVLMNDLPVFINDAFLLVYADDVKIFYPVKNSTDCYKLQADLDKFKIFCEKYGLMVNSSKCSVLTFSYKQINIEHQYRIGDFVLERLDTVRDLGVLMDKKLSFNAHIDGVISKAFSMFGLVKRYARDFDDPYTIVTLYIALVRSRMEYAGNVWTPQYGIHKQRLERVQKKFVQFALRDLGWREGFPPYADLCKLLNLETLDSRRKVNDILFLKDLLTDRFHSPYLRGQITFNEGRRDLRRVRLFQLPARSTNYSMNEPIRRMMSTANEVQDIVSVLDSRKSIKDKLKVHYMYCM